MARTFLLGAAFVVATLNAPSAGEWQTYTSKQFGIQIAYPGDLIDYSRSRPARGEFALKNGGQLILTKDDLGGRRLPDFLKSTLLREVDVTYTRNKNGWMAYSGYVGDQIVYGRSQLSCGGRTAHTFLMRYPIRERAVYDPVVERLSHSLRVEPGAKRAC